MNSRSHSRTIACLLFLLIATSASALGQSGDVRLSYDPWQPVLPAEALIQSGAESGGWTLAVFGTTEWLGDSIVPVLMMQLLKDTALSGPQQKLTSEEARPSGYVQVVAVGERFLVFWRDRRGGDTSIWMRTVDRDGKLGPEQKQSDWPFPAQGAMVLPLAGETKLLWNDTGSTERIIAQRIDSLGYPAKEFVEFGSGWASGVIGPFRNGVRAVMRANATPILVDSVGKVIGEWGWEKKFNERWHLSEDGVVTTVRNDTVMVIYGGVLDTVAERMIPLTLPKIDKTRISPNSVCPYRDEDGQLFAIYGIGGGIAPSVYLSVSICFVTARINSNGQGVLLESQSVACQNQSPTSPGYIEVSIGSSYQLMWDGFCRIIIMPTYTHVYSIHGNREDDIENLCKINGVNRIMMRADSLSIQQSMNECLNAPQPTTIVSHALNENRLLRSIQVNIHGVKVYLTTKLALERRNIPEENPAIAVNSDKIMVGWINRGADTTAELVQWGRGADTSIASQSLLTRESIIGRAMMQGTNRFLVGATHQWIKPTPQGDSVYRRCDLYFPTDSGWKTIGGTGGDSSVTQVEMLTWNQNPENDEFLIQFGRNQIYTYSDKVVAVDTEGNQSWRISNPPTSGTFPQIIPVAEKKFYLLDRTSLILETEDSVLQFQKIRVLGFCFAKRLLGPYFLRWSELGQYFEIYRFAENGTTTMVDSLKIEYSNFDYNGIAVAQNSRDSGFVLIYTTPNKGVWIKTLSRQLKELTPLTPIGGSTALTTTPRAIFRGDSLYVVWIDHRNGVADVYGTVVRPQTSFVATEPIEANQQGITIIPNPAVGEARVVVGGARSGDRLVVVREVTGREVARSVIRSGGVDGVIDVSGIAAGAYLVHVAGEVGGALLIVEE